MTDEVTADCTIVMGDLRVRAHKCILAARSPALRTILFGQSKLSESDVVHVNNVSTEAGRTVLEYIYVGDVRHLTKSSVFDVRKRQACCALSVL